MYIGAYIAELIIHENIKITEIDNIIIDDVIIIIAPINLDNEHWALFIADEVSSYILYPYLNSTYTDLGYMKQYTLLEQLKLDIPHFNNCRALDSTNIARDFQQNNFDCGPMVCGYAIHTILNKELINIDISYIREFTDHMMNTRPTLRMAENQLIGHGPPESCDIASEEYIFH